LSDGQVVVGWRAMATRKLPALPAELGKFEGFPDATFRYLRTLTKYNQHPWFNAHKDRYHAFYERPGLQLVEALGPKLRKISKDVRWDASSKGSLFNVVNRPPDEKRPYRTEIDLWFWEGDDRRTWDTTGFYVSVQLGTVTLGVGKHHFEKGDLATYRAAVMDDTTGPALERAIEEALGADEQYLLSFPSLKTIPEGFDKRHPRRKLLKHTGMYVGFGTKKLPPEVHSAKLVDWCLDHFAAMYPVARWIRQNVLLATPPKKAAKRR
jgi:uncharacterized protein (TIGR02453 family)